MHRVFGAWLGLGVLGLACARPSASEGSSGATGTTTGTSGIDESDSESEDSGPDELPPTPTLASPQA